MRPRRRLLAAARALSVFLLFLAISVALLINVWRAPLTSISGTADAVQTSWFLTWTPFALSHHQSPFVSTYQNFPAGINVLWNTSSIGPAILLWPVTAIWNAAVSYNVALTIGMALAGLFAFVAIRRYLPAVLPALAGAAVYAFSPYMIAHVSAHLHQVASAVIVPLVLLLADELFVRQRMRAWWLGVLFAGAAVFQYFTHEENFVTEILAVLLLALVLGLMFRSQVRERWPYVRRVLLVAVAVTAVALAYPLYVQLLGPQRVLGAVHDADLYSTDLLNLVVPDRLQLVAPHAAQSLSNQFTGNASEWNGYVGVPLLLLATLTIVRFWRVPLVRAAGLTAGIVTLLSLGPHLHVAGRITGLPLPWWIAARIPGIRDILPARLMVYVYLALAVVLAFALGRVLAVRAGGALAAAVAACALIPLIPSAPLPATPISTPAFFTTSAVTAIPQGAVVLAVPWAGADTGENIDPMTWTVESHMRFRLIGGYFLGRVSPGQAPLRAFVDSLTQSAPPPPLTAVGAEKVGSVLRQNHVGVVLLAGVPQEAAARLLLTELFGAPARIITGAYMWVLPVPPPAG